MQKHAKADQGSIRRVFGLKDLDKIGSANLEANIVSTLQAGCFIGALVASWFADKYGRRITLIGCAVIATVGTVLQAASMGHLAAMYCGRSVFIVIGVCYGYILELQLIVG